MKKVIATWIHLDTKSEESIYPQVGGHSSSEKFQEVYWKCVVVFFETSLKFNPSVEHILFTNTKQTSLIIDGLDVFKYLANNNVSVRVVKNQYIVPAGYYQSWNNQFFEFSILENIRDYLSKDDLFLLLDSDCVFTKNIDYLFDKLNLAQEDALTYVIDYGPDHVINGCTRRQMHTIFNDLGLISDKIPNYCAGEVFFAKGNFISKVCDDFPMIWNDLMARFSRGDIKLNEEAHVLSFFYQKFKVDFGGLNSHIKRCWTDPFTYRNIVSADYELDILHLPAEKKTGITSVFRKIAKGEGVKEMNEKSYQLIIKQLLSRSKYYITIVPRVFKKIGLKG